PSSRSPRSMSRSSTSSITSPVPSWTTSTSSSTTSTPVVTSPSPNRSSSNPPVLVSSPWTSPSASARPRSPSSPVTPSFLRMAPSWATGAPMSTGVAPDAARGIRGSRRRAPGPARGTVTAMPPPADAPFLLACRNLPAPHVPVWFMRQAGRSLPEYREVRGTGSILDTIRDPDLATEITLQPVRRYGVDAAILYSDIVVPVAALGFGVEVHPGVGPAVPEPFRDESDLDRLRPLDPEADCPYVQQTVRNLVRELGDVPLIGFAGGPFTVASYLVEGGPPRPPAQTKAPIARQSG